MHYNWKLFVNTFSSKLKAKKMERKKVECKWFRVIEKIKVFCFIIGRILFHTLNSVTNTIFAVILKFAEMRTFVSTF